jgi:hypothetical protein
MLTQRLGRAVVDERTNGLKNSRAAILIARLKWMRVAQS